MAEPPLERVRHPHQVPVDRRRRLVQARTDHLERPVQTRADGLERLVEAGVDRLERLVADPLGDLVHHPVGRPGQVIGHARQPLVEGAGEGLVVLGGGAHHLLAQRERVRAHQLGQAVDPRLDRLGDRASPGSRAAVRVVSSRRACMPSNARRISRVSIPTRSCISSRNSASERLRVSVVSSIRSTASVTASDLGADALADGAQAVVERIRA